MLKRVFFTVGNIQNLQDPSYNIDIVLRQEETDIWNSLQDEGKTSYLYDLVQTCDELNVFPDLIVWNYSEEDILV